MLSRSLLARASPFRLSAMLRTQVCLRPLSSLRLAQPAPLFTNSRSFSAAPPRRTENPAERSASPPPSGKCYIGNVPYKVTAEQLKDAFSEFGKIKSVKMLTSDEGMSRGVGFVEFDSVAEAVGFVEAHEADPIFVLDRQIVVRHAQRARDVSKSVDPSDTLMLFEFQGESEGEVRDLFGSYADRILAVRFDKKEANLASRRAFVQFRDMDIATEAMDAFKSQNGDTRVTYARHRQPPSPANYPLTSRLLQRRAN